MAKDRLAVGPGVFGIALLAIAGGAVFAMPIAGALINRFGSAFMTVATGLGLCALIIGPVMAPDLPTFLLAGFALGMMIGSMDVAMDSHGIAVEKAAKVPTVSIFHGGFSLGAMIGTLGGTALLGQFGALSQLLTIQAAGIGLQLGFAPLLLPSAIDKGLSGSHFAWPTRATIGLGILCFLALMTEGSVLDWAAIWFKRRDGDLAILGRLGARPLRSRTYGAV